MSEEGILTTSTNLLSQREQVRLKKYNEMFKKMLNSTLPKKHDCYKVDKKIQKRPNDMRYMVEMELRAKSEPKYYQDDA